MSLLRTSLSLALCLAIAQPSVASASALVAPDQCEGGTPADQLPDANSISADEKLSWAKKLYVEAKGFHDAGNFYCSVIKYEQAYTFAPDKHLFAYNLGVDAWELKDCARVKHYMQLFMVNDDSNPDLRKDAKRILQEAETSPECVTSGGGGGGGPVSGGGGGGGGGTSATPTEVEEAPGLGGGDSSSGGGGGTDEPAKKNVSGMLIGGVVMAVLGAGAVGGGLGTFVLGKNKAAEFGELHDTGNMTTFPQGVYDADLEKSAKTLGLISPILIGAGAALLVGGVALIVVDRGNKKKGKGAYASKRGFQITGVGAAPIGGGAAASMSFRF